MNRTGALLFLGLTTASFIAAGAGCSSSTTPASTGTGGHTTTTSSSSSSTTTSSSSGTTTSSSSSTSTSTSSSSSTSTSTSSSSSTSTSTSSSSSGAATLTCASYCSEVMTNCTGTNAQYTSNDICMGVCAGFPAGAISDTSGDTLGCRIYHGGAAAGSAANATTHCPHAGPTGGDPDPKGSAGVCGEPCTAFCEVAAKVCTGTNFPFASAAACTTACQGFAKDTASYNDTDTAKNDMGCRFYHLSAASASAAAATTHCPHIVTASAVCTQ